MCIPPRKRMRRTATAVMAGDFDRPARDVLTSVINDDGTEKKAKKGRKKKDAAEVFSATPVPEQWKGRQKEAETTKPSKEKDASAAATAPAIATSSFWKARPNIHLATMQRSLSVTPPPQSPVHRGSTPESTPGPCESVSTSRTSSKRPRTPDDDEDLSGRHVAVSAPPRPRKKRVAVKKGWKGWVEGSPPPSQKLINLDAVPVLQERRTRSGKNFDAIGVGKEGWI